MHFAVMVIGNNPEEQLAPFQENNMGTCPKEYLEFVERETYYRDRYENDQTEIVMMPDGRKLFPFDDEFKVKEISLFGRKYDVPAYLEIRKLPLNVIYPTFEAFMLDWEGYEERDPETGLYGYWENPNAKWDWYELGGRFSGIIRLKPQGRGLKGRPGVFNNETGIDQARKGDIANLDGIVTYAVLIDGEWYDNFELQSENDKHGDQWLKLVTELTGSLSDDTLVSIYDCHI